MILSEFAKYLQSKNDEIISGEITTTKLLCKWIEIVINKNPKNNVDKIVHREICFAKNNCGDFFIVGKSESGRVLVNALYNFALSYEHFILQKWLIDKKPDDFWKNKF